MENIYWKKTVGTLIGAIWLYTLASIAASVAEIINAIMNPSGIMGIITDFMSGSIGASSVGSGDVIESISTLIMLVGYYLFFNSLTRFMHLQNDEYDKKCISKIRTAYILLLASLLVANIPTLGGLLKIVFVIISYIMLISGYGRLKKSSTFPYEARRGASLLFSCAIWILVGNVLEIIPLLGSVIEGIITLITFFLIIAGWKRIEYASPCITRQKAVALEQEEQQAYKQMISNILIVFFVLAILYCLMNIFSGYAFISSTDDFFLSSLTDDRVIDFSGMLHLPTSTTLVDVSNLLLISSLVLSIWGSLAPKKIKIIVSLYPFFAVIYWGFMQQYVLNTVESNATNMDLSTFYLLYPLVWLGIIIMFLISITFSISKWKKESDSLLTD